jgi:hypothetical protein
MHIDLDGSTLVGSTAIASTGGWQTWTTTSLGSVTLTPGEQVLTIHIDQGEFNINWLDFQLQ